MIWRHERDLLWRSVWGLLLDRIPAEKMVRFFIAASLSSSTASAPGIATGDASREGQK
jgi:hypothetical protein